VLEVHGTNDHVVPFAGGPLPFAGAGAVPSAEDTARLAAQKNGCKATTSSAGGAVDVDANVPGAETTRTRYDACPSGAAVELWQVKSGEHVPRVSDAWPEAMWGFLEKQKKP
jgi:poly(3-hydroxybutyrate) depolymerase